MADRHPVTPDGRYFVVRGRLWRRTNPALPKADRQRWVKELMAARRELRRDNDDPQARSRARQRVQTAKEALGERGPVWWDDEAPDYNRHLVRNTPYADWYRSLEEGQDCNG